MNDPGWLSNLVNNTWDGDTHEDEATSGYTEEEESEFYSMFEDAVDDDDEGGDDQ